MNSMFEYAVPSSDLFDYARYRDRGIASIGADDCGAWVSLGGSRRRIVGAKEMRQIILRLYDREDKWQKLHMRRILNAMKETANVD